MNLCWRSENSIHNTLWSWNLETMERVGNGAVGFDDEDERDEIMRLTQMAKSWDFTCSFCFKKFPSAQAMGGHQNAHRNERLLEKRLFVKDPISFRKRNYIKAIKKAAVADAGGGLGGSVNVADRGVGNGINGGAPRRPPPVVMRDFMGVEEQEAAAGRMIGGCKGTTAQCDDEMNVDLTLKL